MMKSSAGRRRSITLLAACALSILLPLGSAAQQKGQRKSYAVIAGTVWTAQERGAPSVKVKIRRADDKPNRARWELFTNARGEFTQRVPSAEAEYVIWVEAKDRKEPAAQTTVEIVGDEILDVALHLAE